MTLTNESSQKKYEGYILDNRVEEKIQEFLAQNPICKEFNGVSYYKQGRSERRGGMIKFVGRLYRVILFKAKKETTCIFSEYNLKSDATLYMEEFRLRNIEDGYIDIKINTDKSNVFESIKIEYIKNNNPDIKFGTTLGEEPYSQVNFINICPSVPTDKYGVNFSEYKGWYPNNGICKAFIDLIKSKFNIAKSICNGIIEQGKPDTPIPEEGEESGQTNNSTCSNSGQFGGGGTPLKDIKLFLYANNVTKGTIKLSKPQVEVGTFATDWRPNPSDYVHVNNSNFKRINGIAMQHSDVSGKTFLEIQAKDGTVFGIDTWGGTQKLLEQQQAEIEELKKLVQTLETKINV